MPLCNIPSEFLMMICVDIQDEINLNPLTSMSATDTCRFYSVWHQTLVDFTRQWQTPQEWKESIFFPNGLNLYMRDDKALTVPVCDCDCCHDGCLATIISSSNLLLQ